MLSISSKLIRISQKGILPLWFGHPLQTVTKNVFASPMVVFVEFYITSI